MLASCFPARVLSIDVSHDPAQLLQTEHILGKKGMSTRPSALPGRRLPPSNGRPYRPGTAFPIRNV